MRVLTIRSRADVVVAGELAKSVAEWMGFRRTKAVEIGIVACELASNVLKHAGSGTLTVSWHDRCLRVATRDNGPPMSDFETALRDGHDGEGAIDPAAYWRRGGIGCGLGALARMATELKYHAEEGGKVIAATFANGIDERTPPGQRFSESSVVLVADDDSAVRALAARILQSAGYQVLMASNGREAVQLAERPHRLLLAVLDVRMPVCSGPEAATLIRLHQPGLPVLFMSGELHSHLWSGEVSSTEAFLRKPFNPSELLAKVTEVAAPTAMP